MTRSGLNKALHWGHAFLMLLVLLAPSVAVIALYALVALVWSGVFALKGPAHRPGIRLDGLARAFHRWSHRALYLVVFCAGLAAVAVLAGLAAPLRPLLLTLVAGGALHAVFHLWRHTTLMDGALKLILPRAMHHGIL